MKNVLRSLIIVVVGVFGVDYFSHLLFSNPMETLPYFLTKGVLYFVFSLIFLHYLNPKEHEFRKVALAGIGVALI